MGQLLNALDELLESLRHGRNRPRRGESFKGEYFKGLEKLK